MGQDLLVGCVKSPTIGNFPVAWQIRRTGSTPIDTGYRRCILTLRRKYIRKLLNETSIVLHSYGLHKVIPNATLTLNVYVTGSESWRVENIALTQSLSTDSARKKLKAVDKEKIEPHRYLEPTSQMSQTLTLQSATKKYLYSPYQS
ncbi:MAG TPA: hypothetical protein EYP00_04190 [Dehalococcoidia bacterium]|nr:hypothetical protein [Dehalococcoidia bacterium]